MKLPELKFTEADIEPGRRVLVTSDIHGGFDHLNAVLAQAGFTADDVLVIAGDIVEKGPRSLDTLRFVMRLCEGGGVIPLIGNVDAWRLHMIDTISDETAADFYDYLTEQRGWKGTSLFDEMTRELGQLCESPGDIVKIKSDVITHFNEELSFLASLPTVLETPGFVFVHGGLRDRNIADNRKRTIWELTKYDWFMNTEHRFDRYVVAGHWPVCNYDRVKQSYIPIIDAEKKIISIDGGCGIKRNGQLNLLVIPDITGGIDGVHSFAYDGLPVYRAETEQAESSDSININWSTNKVEVLHAEGSFTYIRHAASGKKLRVPSHYIYDGCRCDDYTDYVLPVSPGDALALVEVTPAGCIVKKNGVLGWYFGTLAGMGDAAPRESLESGTM